VVGGAEATVEDLQSKNGTRVNGERVDRTAALKDGDRVQFGSVTMTYRVPKSLPSTVTRGA
jgi:pSer/pThr/pTyr-binding forkhead associated (FHA) protein